MSAMRLREASTHINRPLSLQQGHLLLYECSVQLQTRGVLEVGSVRQTHTTVTQQKLAESFYN